MKKITFIILMISLALSSCQKDILEKKPLDIISDDILWKDPALLDAYLLNCYNEIGFIADIEYKGDRNWFPLMTQITIGDECSLGFGQYLRPDHRLGKSYLLRADITFTDYWAYSLVRKLNEFIERVPDSPIDENFKKLRTAEARFLRAFCYFNMVKRYGGIPIIITPQSIKEPLEELQVKRDTEEAVYDFILTELDAIVNDLQDIKDGKGRPTKYAVLALSSRVAMYAASIATWGQVQLDGIIGIPANKAQQYWQKSYDASNAIITSGKFQLYNKMPDDKTSNFRNIFLDENNVEVIFSEIYDGRSGKGHQWDFLNNPTGLQAWATGSCGSPYLEMAEEFEYKDGSPGIIDRKKIGEGYLWTIEELYGQRDPRFHASILTQGSKWLGQTLNMYKGIITEDGTIINTGTYKGISSMGINTRNFPTQNSFTLLKYQDESMGIAAYYGDNGVSKTDWIVFRYSEILLNFAEATFELGKTTEALDAVNKIRDRAGIAFLTSIDRDKIRHERKVELFAEAHRYWDVRRWRTAETELSKKLSNLRYILDYKTRKFKLQIEKDHDGAFAQPFLPKHYYYPIGLNRTNNNPNLVENPGY